MYPLMRYVIGTVFVCIFLLLGANYKGFFLKPSDAPALWNDTVAVKAVDAAAGGGAGSATNPEGAKIFQTNCAACHQPTGMGIPGVFPALVGSAFAQSEDATLPVRIVLHGFQGEIERGGKKINGVMTPFKDILSDEQIAQVLSFVRSSWGNKASAIEAAQVKEVRTKTASHKGGMTEAELQKPA